MPLIKFGPILRQVERHFDWRFLHAVQLRVDILALVVPYWRYILLVLVRVPGEVLLTQVVAKLLWFLLQLNLSHLAIVKVIVIILIVMLVFNLLIGCLGLGLLFVRLFLLVLLDHHEAVLTLIRCFILVLSGKQLVSRAELDAILLEAIVECFHRFVLGVVS